LSATYDSTQKNTGFGGNGGLGVTGCPSGYFGVGKQCVYFPTGIALQNKYLYRIDSSNV